MDSARITAIAPGLVLGVVFACCTFKQMPERGLWRSLACLSVLVGTLFVYLGSAGLILGCMVPLVLPLVYFAALQYRQFSLLDALLFLLILASLGTSAARVNDALNRPRTPERPALQLRESRPMDRDYSSPALARLPAFRS